MPVFKFLINASFSIHNTGWAWHDFLSNKTESYNTDWSSYWQSFIKQSSSEKCYKVEFCTLSGIYYKSRLHEYPLLRKTKHKCKEADFRESRDAKNCRIGLLPKKQKLLISYQGRNNMKDLIQTLTIHHPCL